MDWPAAAGRGCRGDGPVGPGAGGLGRRRLPRRHGAGTQPAGQWRLFRAAGRARGGGWRPGWLDHWRALSGRGPVPRRHLHEYLERYAGRAHRPGVPNPLPGRRRQRGASGGQLAVRERQHAGRLRHPLPAPHRAHAGAAIRLLRLRVQRHRPGSDRPRATPAGAEGRCRRQRGADRAPGGHRGCLAAHRVCLHACRRGHHPHGGPARRADRGLR